jgi:hypothetical protein
MAQHGPDLVLSYNGLQSTVGLGKRRAELGLTDETPPIETWHRPETSHHLRHVGIATWSPDLRGVLGETNVDHTKPATAGHLLKKRPRSGGEPSGAAVMRKSHSCQSVRCLALPCSFNQTPGGFQGPTEQRSHKPGGNRGHKEVIRRRAET